MKFVVIYLVVDKLFNIIIILVYGYCGKSGKVEMVGFVWMYYEKFGYNVLMFDVRVYGKSEGENIGFGWFECKDYV